MNGRYSVCISGAKILKEIGDCVFRAVILTTNFQVRTDLQIKGGVVELHFYIFRQETKAQAREFKFFNNSRDSVKAFVDKSSMIEITIFFESAWEATEAHEKRQLSWTRENPRRFAWGVCTIFKLSSSSQMLQENNNSDRSECNCGVRKTAMLWNALAAHSNVLTSNGE